MVHAQTLVGHLPQHAFLLSGSKEDAQALAADFKKNGATVELHDQSMLSMEHALFVRSFNTEDTAVDRWIIVSFTFFHNDAVQVLLKTLEEPRAHTYFIFMTPYPYLIPETIRSRVLLIHSEVTHQKELQQFLKQSPAQKFTTIKEQFSTDDEESAAVRKQSALALLDMYERHYKEGGEKKRVALETIYAAKKMMLRAQLPPKQVLEYLVTMIG